MSQRIAILGAGAAGCFAAANIPKAPGREVIVFEKTGKALQKVKVSGGGRCNVTHRLFDIPELVRRYPRGGALLRKSLHHFGPADMIAWLKLRGVQVKAEADGRMFPVTDSSQTIIDAIWGAMQSAGVQLRYNKAATTLKPVEGGWEIQFADGSSYTADKVLVACGGFPKAASFDWLRALGHSIAGPVPSLFTFNLPKHPVTALMGLSVSSATVKIRGTKIEEGGPVLITHWGLSGPAVLRASAWGARELAEKGYDFTAVINWLGELSEEDLKAFIADQRRVSGRALLAARPPFELPRRLWQHFLEQCGIGETVRWGELAAKAQNGLVQQLVRAEYAVKGKTTFKEEFVTAGGIKASEVSPQTMESRLHQGLYFAGEVLDVDGITGGFNFQHAWCSGWLAAAGMTA